MTIQDGSPAVSGKAVLQEFGIARFRWVHTPPPEAWGVSVAVVSVPPGQEWAPHRHSGYEQFVYVLGGCGEQWVNGVRQSLRQGACAYIPGGATHRLVSRGPGELHLLAIYNPVPVSVGLPPADASALPSRRLPRLTELPAGGALEALMRKEFVNILVTWPHLLRREEVIAQACALGLRGGVPRVVLAARPGVGPAGDPAGGPETDHLRWPSGDMLVVKTPSLVTAVATPWPEPPARPEEWVASAVRQLEGLYGVAACAGDYAGELGDLPASYRTAVARLTGGCAAGKDVLEREMRVCEHALRGDVAGASRAVAELLSEMGPVERTEEVRVLAGLLAAAFVRAGLDPAVAADSRARLLRVADGMADRGAAEAIGEFVRELRWRFAETQSTGEQAVALARAYVEENYHQDLTLRQVAAHVYLSPFYFARLFKAHTGMTLGEYVTEVRLRKACELLRNTSLPVTAVARRVGYCSPSYFSALFSKTFGVSPGQYRESFGGWNGIEGDRALHRSAEAGDGQGRRNL